ncbi:MAG TPA: hypothetical protein VN841_01345 [Bryobacteraceae bacterium]|nr:hypothetical protein [Bryobacteraceae bacterium]
MRAVWKNLLLAVVFGAVAGAQTLTEAAAAAAGGTVGGAAGKKVSEGITNIFEKVDKQAAAAAVGDPKAGKAKSATTKAPLIEAGPGRPDNPPATKTQADKNGFVPPAAPNAAATKPKATAKAVAASAPPKVGDPVVVPPSAWDDVPPPPPLPRHTAVVTKPAPKPVAAPPAPVVFVAPPPPPPPPPVTLEDLQRVQTGMTRAEVLKIGEPAARITMFEDGGLLEIFTYYSHDPVNGDRSLGTVRLNDGAVSDFHWLQ